MRKVHDLLRENVSTNDYGPCNILVYSEPHFRVPVENDDGSRTLIMTFSVGKDTGMSAGHCSGNKSRRRQVIFARHCDTPPDSTERGGGAGSPASNVGQDSSRAPGPGLITKTFSYSCRFAELRCRV